MSKHTTILSNSEPSIAVVVARNALIEVGRPDLARRVKENGAHHPMMEVRYKSGEGEEEIVAKAFWLGHNALYPDHHAKLTLDAESGLPCIWCAKCLERDRAKYS